MSADASAAETKEVDVPNMQYIYIVKNNEDMFILKGCRSTKAFQKVLKKTAVYGVFPTVNSESDRAILYNKFYSEYGTKKINNLDFIRTTTNKFYKEKYNAYKRVLKERKLYTDYITRSVDE